MTADERQFFLEEFKQLHAEVDGALKYHQDMVRFALAASAAIFAWLATFKPEARPGLRLAVEAAWYLPAAIAFLSLVGSAAWYWRVHEIGTYLEALELRLGIDGGGWQTWQASRPTVLGPIALLFWLLLLIGNTTVACIATGGVSGS
jgi:hypothetical protein